MINDAADDSADDKYAADDTADDKYATKGRSHVAFHSVKHLNGNNI
jgi:hypothetical protein